MVRKKKEVTVTFVDIADKGFALGHSEDGFTVLCKGPLPNEKWRVLLLRKRKGLFYGKALEIFERSACRVEPLCKHFEHCGGCQWQHMNYVDQYSYKRNSVIQKLQRIGKITSVKISRDAPAYKQYFYRNKLEFSFSTHRWLIGDDNHDPALGFHAPGSFYKIVHIDFCHLQLELTNDILNFVYRRSRELGIEFYNYKEHRGVLRNLLLRRNIHGDFLVTLIFAGMMSADISTLLEEVFKQFVAVKSVWFIINNKLNDDFSDCEQHHFIGQSNIVERILDRQYTITPKSFFQTNSHQAETLFKIIRSYLPHGTVKTLYDVYCGAGSIGIALADRCRQILGIEKADEAIADARRNCEINDIKNISFVCSAVENLDLSQLEDSFPHPDVIIVDPPRAGLTLNLISWLCSIMVDRLIYVSCNPATLARDCQLLAENYTFIETNIVDMFPHSSHIETVSLLTKITE